MTKILKSNGSEFRIEALKSGWFEVFMDDETFAKVVSEEEARRVIWLELKEQGAEIEFVTNSMFTVAQYCTNQMCAGEWCDCNS